MRLLRCARNDRMNEKMDYSHCEEPRSAKRDDAAI
jgi:hypothetical protein